MPKIVVSLTDSAIRSAISAHKKTEPKVIKKLADGSGLYLILDKNGSMYWRFDYTRPITKKRNSISMGVYPEVTLAQARLKRTEYKQMIRNNQDPIAEKRRAEEKEAFVHSNTFEFVANEYRKIEELAPATKKKNRFIWDKLYMSIGRFPISEITPTQILDACRIYESQGKYESARLMRSKAAQVFRYAISLSLCQFNVADQISGILKTGTKEHRKAIVDKDALGQLLVNIDKGWGKGSIIVDYAVKILPHVFVRPGELRSAKWADIDFEKRLWCYTPSKTQSKTALEHIVPLSNQVYAMFKELYIITGGREYVFAATKLGVDFISDSTINKRLKQYGFENGETTGHGMRATARTLLDEELRFPIERIEQQLAHQVRDMHGRAYNRTKYLDERTDMMQAWSDYLDQLKVS